MFSFQQVRHIWYTHSNKRYILTSQYTSFRNSRDTYWTCRFAVVEAVCTTFDAILATLQCLVQGDYKLKAVEAKGILLQIQCIKFL